MPDQANARDINCEPLEPDLVGSQTNFDGSIEGKVDGLFSKFAGIDAAIKGKYEDIVESIISEFPVDKRERVYLWSRVLYLQCEFIASAKITDSEKLKSIGELYILFSGGPP